MRSHDIPTVSPSQAATLVAYCINAKIPAWLWGPPGSAKSETVWQVCSAMGRHMVPLNLQNFERVDLAGVPSVDDGATRWNPPAMLPRGPVDGREPVIFWDEANTAPMDVQAVMFPAVRENRIGDARLSPGTAHVAAGNEAVHRAAAKRTATALNNRFAHFRVAMKPADWIDWADGRTAAAWSPPAPLPARTDGAPVHRFVRAFIRLRPECLAPDLWADPDVIAFPSARTWELVSRIADAPRPWLDHLVMGLVGTAAGAEFVAFVDQMQHIPDPRAIIADPDGAPVPPDNKPGARYALVTALARMATAATVDAVFRYVDRLPADYAVLCGHAMAEHSPSLRETAAYVAHAIRYQTVTM